MVDQSVNVRVQTESVGNELYETHVTGMRGISTAAKENVRAFRDARQEAFSYRLGLMAVNAAVSGFTAVATMAGIKNEALQKVIVAVNAAMAVANSLLILHTILQSKAAAATWMRVAAMVAASGWGAPILAAIVAGATAAVIATAGKSTVKPQAMAMGGTGIVTRPTLFLAGEAGPEAYGFEPLGAKATQIGGSVGTININIQSNDPDAVGRAVVAHIRKYKEVGR